MLQGRLAGLSRGLAIVLAAVAVLVVADVVVAIQLAARHSSTPVATAAGAAAGNHPCNHGYYVSHSKKGGGYVSGVAHSKLGKDGSCTGPLPSQASAAPQDGSDN